MADQLLRREMFTVNERLDAFDLNETNNLAAANLGLGIAKFIAPSGGVVNGGALTAAGGMLLTLAPLAAIIGNQLIIVESAQAVGPFRGNADPNGYARLDLVSIGYSEAVSNPEQRTLISPDSGQTYAANINTKITATPTITITQGVPAANPVLPATPAGQLALYQVEVDSGAAQITADKITQIAASRVDRVRSVFESLPGGVAAAVPWVSSKSLGCLVPAGSAALLIASFEGMPVGDQSVATFSPVATMAVSIEDVAAPNVALGRAALPFWSATYTGVTICPQQTATVLVPLSGPIAYTNYRLRVQKDTNAFGQWTHIYPLSYSLTAVLA